MAVCWSVDVLKNDHTIPKQKYYIKTREAERITPKKRIKKIKKLLQKLLTNFLYYSIMFIVKREEEKTNEKKNKKTNKKNIALYNSKCFIIWIVCFYDFIRFEHKPNNNKII